LYIGPVEDIVYRIQEGTVACATVGLKVSFALGVNVGFILGFNEGAVDGASLGFTDGRLVLGMNDG
jgi:ABC-type dipeptide/oligopeptide/nickel transport system permease subunit